MSLLRHGKNRSMWALTALTALSFGQSSIALAQPAIEELVVTARKREESILDIPFGLSAFSAQTLEKYDIKDFTDLQRITPGFVINEINTGRSDRGPVNYVIRGLNLPQVVGAGDAALLFVDGAPVAGGRLASFMNAERVEVLKGPQTAYFGRNTFSGAINIVTKTPGNEWQARAVADASSFKSSSLDLSAEGAIIEDKLAVRAAGIRIDKGGHYKDNATGGRLGDRLTEEASLTFYATPTDQMTLKVFGSMARLTDGPSASYDMSGVAFGNCNVRSTAGANNWFCGELPWTDIGSARAGAPAVFDQRFIDTIITPYSLFDKRYIDDVGLAARNRYASANLSYDFGGMTFNSIAAYHKSIRQVAAELSKEGFFQPCLVPAGCGRPFGQTISNLESRYSDRSIEGRLTSDQSDRLRWTIGANYISAGAETSNAAGEQVGRLPSFSSNSGKTAVKTLSAFGGIYYDVTTEFTVSAELRRQRDKVRSIPFNNTLLIPDTANAISGTFKSTGPRITVEYKFDEDVRVFANWARGFRPGTFNSRLRTLSPEAVAILTGLGAQLQVNPERLDQYEVGMKGTFFDSRLQTSVVGYWGKITDQQVNNNAIVPVNNVPTNVTFLNNAGLVKIKGLEAEAALAVTEEFSVNGSFAWNWTEVKKDFCAVCLTLTGNAQASVGKRLQDVPQYTASLSTDYTDSFTSTWDWFFRTEYAFTGNRYGTKINTEKTGVGHKVNMRVGLQSDLSTLELYVKNLTNDKTVDNLSQGTDFLALTTTVIAFGLPDKRVWGVRASYRF